MQNTFRELRIFFRDFGEINAFFLLLGSKGAQTPGGLNHTLVDLT